MKYFTTALLLIFTSICAFAQKTDVYEARTGKNLHMINFVYTPHEGNTRLTFIINDVTAIQDIDKDYKTIYWHYRKTSDNTDVKVVIEGSFYHMTGKAKGKPVDKKIETQGKPWYQHIGVVVGHLIKPGETITFGNFRPTELDFYTMTATDKGSESFGPYSETRRIKVSPTGALARLWSCEYFIDPKTHEYLGYKAVEGVPGTPLTTWTLIR